MAVKTNSSRPTRIIAQSSATNNMTRKTIQPSSARAATSAAMNAGMLRATLQPKMNGTMPHSRSNRKTYTARPTPTLTPRLVSVCSPAQASAASCMIAPRMTRLMT
ncbi:MAG: hypothetical protein BWY52_02863 [Chloroflexi bacterium ADurb.Bin325]|nr:MAG: hypothetical protein BWY52_02863 [Chloroflexi bacterium ADurb.Bin325]